MTIFITVIACLFLLFLCVMIYNMLNDYTKTLSGDLRVLIMSSLWGCVAVFIFFLSFAIKWMMM